MPDKPVQNTNKVTYISGIRQISNDLVIKEQPLQLRLSYYQSVTNGKLISQQLSSTIFSITMRTPGNDKQLILGLLFSEGVIKNIADIDEIIIEQNETNKDHLENNNIAQNELPTSKNQNLWEIRLNKNIKVDLNTLKRYLITYSSCGLCGTTSLKSLELKSPPNSPRAIEWLDAKKLGFWPNIMKENQQAFHQTGGAHAAAIFDQLGNLLDIKEDIGRHNAVDKVIGELIFKNDNFPMNTNKGIENKISLVVSSRVSFEIVQKAIMAGIGVIIAVGAVSDLAILAAKRFNLTLIGFATSESFNLYHGEWRMMPPSKEK
ncbi:MAG: formate dehydrogenase accessory sulfurtransferase FdhD [Colwelliaceae bacterium]|nr:formate dehydrogenase accessory sulfurtransferase FdhD [Colwelliaceae bacterium]